MIEQTIAPPAVIPWDDVETLVKSGLSVQSIVDQMGIPDQFERVKRQVTRKGWVKSSPASTLKTATEQLQTLKSEIVPNVPNAAEALANVGTRTKAAMANAALRASERIQRCDDDELIEPSVAEVAKKWTDTAAKVHGWDAQAGTHQTVVNIGFLCPASHEDARADLVIEQEGHDSGNG